MSIEIIGDISEERFLELSKQHSCVSVFGWIITKEERERKEKEELEIKRKKEKQEKVNKCLFYVLISLSVCSLIVLSFLP